MSAAPRRTGSRSFTGSGQRQDCGLSAWLGPDARSLQREPGAHRSSRPSRGQGESLITMLVISAVSLAFTYISIGSATPLAW